MIYGITLILLGLLAIPSLVLAKKPDAKALFDKIAPYQGWIGVIFAIWGLWSLLNCFLNLGWLGAAPILWITWLVVSVVETALGFILGYGLLSKHALSKNAAAAAKGEQLLQKLLPLQGKLGILAIVLGAWMVIASLLFAVAA